MRHPFESFSIPDWVRWLAQDSSGAWWGYSVEPLRNDKGWYENEVGDYVLLGTSEPLDWPNSLKQINV
ncbi:hypothetical protein ACFL3P_04200 [Pseudomonadota bacterium]